MATTKISSKHELTYQDKYLLGQFGKPVRRRKIVAGITIGDEIVKIYNDDWHTYFGAEWFSALKIYNRCKKYGMPHGGGWADAPAIVGDIIDLFEFEESRRAAKNNGSNSGNPTDNSGHTGQKPKRATKSKFSVRENY